MHKDKPPGMFDFGQRSIRYLVVFWSTAGFLLSLLIHLGMLVWRVDFGPTQPKSEEALERTTAPVRPATSPPSAAAVRY